MTLHLLHTLVRVGPWDAAFLAAVSLQATAMAYLHAPRWKVLVFSLPIPFTFGSLALGLPVGVTHMAGLVLLPLFMHAVRLLHYSRRWAIVPAIAAAAAGYCLVGAGLKRVLPGGPIAFAAVAAAALVLALVLRWTAPRRDEPGHRSPLPLWAKLPVLAGLVAVLVALKAVLAGFMATYPIMSTMTAYEARKSLWSVCRQIPAVMLSFVPMIVLVRLGQGRIGLGWSLACGWVVFLSVLLPLSWRLWFAPGAPAASDSSGALP